jgi:hypothetical protein
MKLVTIITMRNGQREVTVKWYRKVDSTTKCNESENINCEIIVFI